jgi:ABC-type transport system involved in cytochrome bd biosynthesis fused ATPase/permease subunit
MDQLLTAPSYVTWLLGQSVAVVLLVAWVVSLHRMLKRSSEANQALVERNAQLSVSLAEVVQSSSRERVANQELNLRTVLDAFESALQHKQDG